MIPLSLRLRNFICYRQAELDFSGLHVACLAGENGAGKSALLDAITWALWGRARARRDDELIHLGESEMSVELTFELGGQMYRVLRQRSAAKRGTTLLDFQVQEQGRWYPIAESGVRQTQDKIERVLHLDYETFINSAFLRQGRADEFTIKTAGERKRVLSDILGLERWALYEERVKERQRRVAEETEQTEARLREIEEELALQPQFEAQVAAAQREVEEYSAVLEAAQAAYQEIETARTELRHAEVQHAEIQERLAQIERELEGLANQQAAHERALEEAQALLEQADEIEAGYRAYQEALAREQALGAKLSQSAALNERRRTMEAQIANARRELEGQCQVARQRLADLQKQIAEPALRAEYEEVKAQLTHLSQLAQSRAAAEADLSAIGQEQAELRSRQEALRQEIEALHERIAQLEQAEAECPLCGQPLSDEHRAELLLVCRREGQEKDDLMRAQKERSRALAERARLLKQQIEDSDGFLRHQNALLRQEAALEARLRQSQEAEAQMAEHRQTLAALEERLAAEDYGHEARAELAAVLEEAAALGYDQAAHEQARRDVASGQPYAERKLQLAGARARVLEEQAALDRLGHDRRRWQRQHKQEQARAATLEEQVAMLRERLRAAPAVEARLRQARGEEAAARQRLGAATQRLEACKALAQQRTERRQRLEALAAERAIYEELRTAFGIKGVPAMIIEAVVPEIETEANELLARMTAGRMHVRFETQQETQAGKPIETLEIRIADELGERPYENYSGGEQFRVNFAIRVALSRLLARRAGAQLQTLVVDEGFGTQDAQGRERLVEAINAIQDDFARVLVITHIEELQDAFPARIEVTKTPDGSVVTVG